MVNFRIDRNGQMYIPDVTKREVTLYSTDCPKCKVLESKLQNKGVYYTKNTSISEIKKLGFTTAPILNVDDKYLEFGEAIKWVNNVEGE